MQIGLIECDKTNFPNLPLMKISAYHKARGDCVEEYFPMKRYDKVYISKIFGDEYSKYNNSEIINADYVDYGGTGYAITVENNCERYCKEKDKPLPDEIEHIYPDYDLYRDKTKNTSFGFLTRGCPNNCDFCIVCKKEGRKTKQVADLSEWHRGQSEIKLCDPNILASHERLNLLQQLKNSGAWVDFTQGLDARFIDDDVAKLLSNIKTKAIHFAFDLVKNEKQILKGLECFRKYSNLSKRKCSVYILTNFNTTIEEDIYRVRKVEENNLMPDIRIYRKQTAPQILKDLQRWSNNRILYNSIPFEEYIPRADGRTIKEIYGGLINERNFISRESKV